MDFNVKVEGLEQLGNTTQDIRNSIAIEVRKALYASAKYVEKEAKVSIQNSAGKRGGRFYKRRSVLHQASAPGEAPSTDTGRLVNSINGYMNSVKGDESFVVAGNGVVKYARMLEFGTSKMAARPFFFPAFERSKQWIQNRLNKAVRDAVIKAVKKGGS